MSSAKSKNGIFSKLYLALIIVFLYLPIIVFIIFSFNNSMSTVWNGFTLKWYESLFKDKHIMNSLWNTLIIAVLASFFATILGTSAAIGISNFRGKKRTVIQTVSNIPIISPDIVMGVSLMLLFTFLGVIFNFEMGFVTVLLSHICFCVPFVVLNVMPQLMKMNPNLYEAALDLGATPMQALRKVIIPELKSGMISGFILAITLSVDDFAVTLFTKGSGTVETLSTYIYADARKGGLTPELRPLFSIIFLVILVLLVFYNLKTAKQTSNN